MKILFHSALQVFLLRPKVPNLRCLETLPRLDLLNVCLWLGLLMAKHFLLVTLITKSVSGRFPSPLPVKRIRTIIGHCAMRYFDDILKLISSFVCWWPNKPIKSVDNFVLLFLSDENLISQCAPGIFNLEQKLRSWNYFFPLLWYQTILKRPKSIC